ncbi:hypothetical protein ICM05_09750 [Leucobacter sp. cx-42]|uniref:hypothetical protein n=1 Tax=unclassified Leucobacter TaxID=2621730 RepID=UPI00165D74C1|nr:MULTISPECIES: hypothetical protein [unclassified Leucobacter]MBC9954921.1 hypothetical protein [Leucobacter sp. cx-42]
MNFNDYVQLAVAVGTLGATLVGIISLVRQSRTNSQVDEYRDVHWAGDWHHSKSGGAEFKLKNTGKTSAKKVRIAVRTGIYHDSPLRMNKAGTFRPGAERVLLKSDKSPQEVESLEQAFFGNHARIEVWWRSPLGYPEYVNF